VGEPEDWQELAARYERAFGQDLRGVALFGSRARGTARADSDHDILLVTAGLSPDVFARARQIREPLRGFHPAALQVLARTPDDFLKDVTPLHLDLALDARVIFERDGFLTEHLERLRELIHEAGLYRTSQLFWRWKRPPRRDWAITWQGVRV
jgi:predicted nucleotidyltransferase